MESLFMRSGYLPGSFATVDQLTGVGGDPLLPM